MNANTTRTTFTLTVAEKTALDAARGTVTLAAALREAVRLYIEKHGGNVPEATVQVGGVRNQAPSYDEIRAMIEVVDEEASSLPPGSLRIICRETDSSWIDTSYIISAQPVTTDTDDEAYKFVYGDAEDEQPSVTVWRLEDPNETEIVKTREEAIDWMIEGADLYYAAEKARDEDDHHRPEFVNVSERYGGLEAVTIEDYRMLNPDSEFKISSELGSHSEDYAVIREYRADHPPGDFEVVARQRGHE